MYRARNAVVPLIVVVLLACSAPRTPIDWSAVEGEGRLVEEPEVLGVLREGAQYHWTDGELELALSDVGGVFRAAPRLFVDVRGSGDAPTRFVVDTGTTATHLSASAPLAREARIARKMTWRVENTSSTGHMGYVPFVRMGPLTGRDLAVAIREQADSPKAPANILGIVHLFHTQMEYDGSRWWLRSGSSRRPPTEAGWTLVRLEQGTPFVRVLDPSGRQLYAMLDTGAPTSMAIPGFPEGEYTLPASDGSVALRIGTRGVAPWAGLEAGGYKLSLIIGMDVLSSRPSRLTFDRSAWSFPPVRP